MARITVASLQSTIAALQAQLAAANEVCANQRDTIARLEETCAAQAERLDNAVLAFKELRAQLRSATAEPSTPAVVTAVPVPTRTCYRDAKGQLWERTRYSATRSISRIVDEASPADAS